MGKQECHKETYPSDKRYLSFPEAREGRKCPNTFTRQRDGADSWQSLGRVVLFLITCFIKDQWPTIRRNSEFWIVLKFDVALSGIFIISVGFTHTVGKNAKSDLIFYVVVVKNGR